MSLRIAFFHQRRHPRLKIRIPAAVIMTKCQSVNRKRFATRSPPIRRCVSSFRLFVTHHRPHVERHHENDKDTETGQQIAKSAAFQEQRTHD